MTPTSRTTWERYGAYLRRAPELSVEWNDRETDARGWLVVNSLRGGAAGGGTRMRSGLDRAEVVYLSKAMELKFALTGPPIGGAKSGIDFDPSDPRKPDVLERWYAAIEPVLRARYGTAGDLNVDEILDVVPAIRRLGLRHPQEGIVRGHYAPDEAGLERTLRLLDRGAEARLNGRLGVAGMDLGVADMVTGYGVAESVLRWYEQTGRPVEEARIAMEGFGNVGAACALYLARAGARVVAVSDAEKSLVDDAGLDAAGVEDLLRRSRNRLIPADDPRVVRDGRRRFSTTPADVFVCAAISESVDSDRLDALAEAGVRVIACGANHPFREGALGGTEVQQAADARFAVLADVLANCGRARAFGYLMEPGSEADETAIFDAVRRTIRDALDETVKRAGDPSRGLLSATTDMLLDRIGAP